MTTTNGSTPIRTLLEDPIFRKMMKTEPRLPRNLRHGEPWQLWAVREGRWATKRYATYRDVYQVLSVALKRRDEATQRPHYDDVAVVSLRYMIAPPDGLTIALEGLGVGSDWCWRCRRPVEFGFFRRHHAMQGHDRYTSEAQLRCPFCGMRRMAMDRVWG